MSFFFPASELVTLGVFRPDWSLAGHVFRPRREADAILRRCVEAGGYVFPAADVATRGELVMLGLDGAARVFVLVNDGLGRAGEEGEKLPSCARCRRRFKAPSLWEFLRSKQRWDKGRVPREVEESEPSGTAHTRAGSDGEEQKILELLLC